MASSFAEIRGKLIFYEREFSRYTRCLRRGTELILSGRPEEVVRQALLYYLLCESGLIPGVIYVAVEDRYLDIVVYRPVIEPDFRPQRPPLAIIEVKREEANLLDHNQQLFDYMREQRVDTGVLFNGNAIIAYTRDAGGSHVASHLTSLDALGDLLQRLAAHVDPYLSTFRKARDGDIVSFVALVQKFGKYAVHKITFALKGSPDGITGSFFVVQGEKIEHDVYGRYSKHRLAFDRSQFDRLLSVIY